MSTIEPQAKPITIYRVGTPESPHITTVRAFHAYLAEVLATHEPTSEYPEARLEFPNGWWLTLTTAPDKEAPQP